MKRRHFLKYVQDMNKDIENILCTKGEVYVLGTDDQFKNFRTVAESLNLDQKKVLWIYLRKHLDAILHHILNESADRDPEGIQSRVQDCVCYLQLLGGMFLEESQEANQE